MRRTSSLTMAVLCVTIVIGCQSKTSTSSSSSNEELRLLTPEQEQKLYELADKVEPKETIKQSIMNDNGEVVGTVTSQTTVIYLKRSAGGGRFSVNETCTNSCTGVPINLKPGGTTQENSCHCNDKCDGCTGAVDSQGCAGTCTKTKTGFGDFGIFIAMENGDPQDGEFARR
jgi:hypothetical protein